MPRKARPPELYRDIPVYAIDRMGRLAGVKARLDAKHGPGAWGRDEVVDYMLGQQAEKAKEAEGVDQTRAAAAHARDIALGKKRAAYLRTMTNVTPGDLVMVDQMVEISQQLEELSAPGAADETGTSLKARSQVRLSLIAELRRIQNDLGIGRSQRADEVDQAETVKAFVDGASALLKARGIRLECPHCRGQSQINQGFILFHFKDHVPWRWTATCPNPKCGKEYTIEGGPPAHAQIDS